MVKTVMYKSSATMPRMLSFSTELSKTLTIFICNSAFSSARSAAEKKSLKYRFFFLEGTHENLVMFSGKKMQPTLTFYLSKQSN